VKLYCSENSPYARKARVVAIELGVADRIESIDTNPRDPASGLWSLNPLAKIPVLVTGAGEAIFDSPVICEYLNDSVGDGRLLPADKAERWRVRTLVALADGILDAGMAARLEGMRPQGEQSPGWTEKQLATVVRGFDALQSSLAAFGERVDLGTIGAGCAIGWMLFRHPDHDWLGSRPVLARWYDAFSARESMKRTAPGQPL
jgi:glutathione S-transferase